MPTIEEIFFNDEQASIICYQELDFFRNYKFYNRSKTVFSLKEFKYIDLSRREEDRNHYQPHESQSHDDIYFINILFSNSEKVVCDENLGGKKLHFWNCVFASYMRFAVVPKEIYFVNCVFLSSCSFLNEYKINRIDFSSCSIRKLIVDSTPMDVLSLASSYVADFALSATEMKVFSVIFSRIRKFSIHKATYEKLELDPRQIIRKNPHEPFFVMALQAAISQEPTSNIENSSHLSRIGRFIGLWPTDKLSQTFQQLEKMRRLETLSFLKRETIYKFSSFARANIDYLQQKILFEDSLFKIILWPLGYFLKPLRIISISLATIIGFGLIYYHNINYLMLSDNSAVVKFWDCLYFSGITFLTVGYGDILPTDFIKGIAVLEGFTGIFMSGLFVVVVTKRILSE